MGMYNEVFKSCPECGTQCEIQIPQVVLGFGGFNLDNLDTLKQLSEKEVLTLKDYLSDETFWCEKCNNPFSYDSEKEEDKIKKIKFLLFEKKLSVAN